MPFVLSSGEFANFSSKNLHQLLDEIVVSLVNKDKPLSVSEDSDRRRVARLVMLALWVLSALFERSCNKGAKISMKGREAKWLKTSRLKAGIFVNHLEEKYSQIFAKGYIPMHNHCTSLLHHLLRGIANNGWRPSDFTEVRNSFRSFLANTFAEVNPSEDLDALLKHLDGQTDVDLVEGHTTLANGWMNFETGFVQKGLKLFCRESNVPTHFLETLLKEGVTHFPSADAHMAHVRREAAAAYLRHGFGTGSRMYNPVAAVRVQATESESRDGSPESRDGSPEPRDGSPESRDSESRGRSASCGNSPEVVVAQVVGQQASPPATPPTPRTPRTPSPLALPADSSGLLSWPTSPRADAQADFHPTGLSRSPEPTEDFQRPASVVSFGGVESRSISPLGESGKAQRREQDLLDNREYLTSDEVQEAAKKSKLIAALVIGARALADGLDGDTSSEEARQVLHTLSDNVLKIKEKVARAEPERRESKRARRVTPVAAASELRLSGYQNSAAPARAGARKTTPQPRARTPARRATPAKAGVRKKTPQPRARTPARKAAPAQARNTELERCVRRSQTPSTRGRARTPSCRLTSFQ